MTEVTFSVPQNDSTTMARTFNLAFLLGHPIQIHANFLKCVTQYYTRCVKHSMK